MFIHEDFAELSIYYNLGIFMNCMPSLWSRAFQLNYLYPIPNQYQLQVYRHTVREGQICFYLAFESFTMHVLLVCIKTLLHCPPRAHD